MANVIINAIDVTELLAEKFQQLGDGWVVLLQLPIEKSQQVNIEAIKTLQSLGYEGVYISLIKDYLDLSKTLREAGVDMGRLAFIDGISQMYGIKKVEAPNVTYVDGPLSTDAIAAAVEKITPSMKSAKRFVFLDSITTVLLYNSLERTLRFSQFLTESLKKLKVAGIIASVAKGFANENLVKELTKVSNVVINLQSGQ